MIYVGTSALVKLVFQQPDSRALTDRLTSRVNLPIVTSNLSTIELFRTRRRTDQGALDDARRHLGGIDRLPISQVVVEQIAIISPRELRRDDRNPLCQCIITESGVDPIHRVWRSSLLSRHSSRSGGDLTAVRDVGHGPNSSVPTHAMTGQRETTLLMARAAVWPNFVGAGGLEPSTSAV